MNLKSIKYYNEILSELKKEPKTISQIANKLKLNYDSTKNHIEELKHLNYIIEIDKNNKKYYQINPNPSSLIDFETYFNLPIELKEKERLETYYYLIKKYWEEITNKKPTITQVYKVLAKLNITKNLNLPIGWYNYGPMPILVYKEESLTEEKIITSEGEKEEIKKIIQEYSKIKLIRKLTQKLYKELDMKSYILKERILDNLYYNKQNKYINEKLIKNFKNLMKIIVKDNLDKEIVSYLNDFFGLLLSFKDVTKAKEKEFKEYKEILINAFKELWKLIAIGYYKKTLNKHFSEEILNLIFDKEIEIQKLTLEEVFYELVEVIEKYTKEFSNPKLRKYFQKIHIPTKIEKDVKLQTLEEQEKMLKDLGLL